MTRPRTSEGIAVGPWPEARPSVLVGRFAELGALVEQAKDASRGSPRVALIEGDAGIGKTRLLEELATQAERLGVRVFSGRPIEPEKARPFSALDCLLRRPLVEIGPERLAALAGQGWTCLKTAFPTVPTPRVGIDEASGQVGPTLAQLLANWAAMYPVALLLDDAHWADSASLEALRVIADRLGSARILLVLAYRGRPPELSRQSRLVLEGLARVARPGAQHLHLGGLDEQDCGSLMSSLLGGMVHPSLVHRIFDVTKGNPFFVEEVIRALRRSPMLRKKQGWYLLAGEHDAWLSSIAGVRAQVLERVSALGSTATLVARLLSELESLQLGGPVHAAFVAASGLSRRKVDAALDELERAAILATREDSVFEYAQPIVRSIVNEELGAAERTALHRAIADHLKAAAKKGWPVSLSEIGVHISRSAVPGDPEAIRSLLEVAAETLPRAPGVAAEWYRRVLELLPPDQHLLRAEVRAHRARSLLVSDVLSEAVEEARRARDEFPHGTERVRANTLLISALVEMGRMDEALHEVDEAIRESGPQARGRFLAHRLVVLLYLDRIKEAEVCGAEALSCLDNDPPAQALAMRELAHAAVLQGRLQEFRVLQDRALERASEVSVRHRALTLGIGASRLTYLGEFDMAMRWLLEADRLSQETPGLAFRPLIDSGFATIDWLQGRWGEAVARFSRLLHEAEHGGWGLWTFGVWTPLISIATDQGNVAEARRYLRALANVRQDHIRPLDREYVLQCEGRLAQLTGNNQAAAAKLEEGLRAANGGHVMAKCALLAELVDVHVAGHHPQEAGGAADELSRVAGKTGAPFLVALADRALLLAKGDMVAGQRARRALSGLGMPFETARTDLAIGSAGADAEALMRAHRTFEALGAEPWRRRAAAALTAIGRSPRRTRKRTAILSSLESQIASLVAGGLFNREIGNTLALSTKTVENYLSRIYTKTGCRGRAALAAAIAQGRLNVGD